MKRASWKITNVSKTVVPVLVRKEIGGKMISKQTNIGPGKSEIVDALGPDIPALKKKGLVKTEVINL